MSCETNEHSDLESKCKVRAWEIVHACNLAREVSSVLEAQTSVGMRPYLMTFNGSLANDDKDSVSLMQSWQHVRQWRKQFDQSSPHLHSNIIHAHSFAAGMAAVRSGDPVVYDVKQWIEVEAASNGNINSWLERSFRTAEQFILTRSGAVVVHSQKLKSECLARGIADEDVYLIPEPIPFDSCASIDSGGLAQSQPHRLTVLVRVVPAAKNRLEYGVEEEQVTTLETLLAAFAQLADEIESANLLVVSSAELHGQIAEKARVLNVHENISCIEDKDEEHAVNLADVIIADPVVIGGAANARICTSNDLAVAGMLRARAVLAADTSCNRDISPDGQGLIWYSPAPKVNELARRISFLGRNPDFCRALGEGGRQHLVKTRSPQRVGKMYDEVYRHAYSKHHNGDPSQDTTGSLIAVQLCS